MARYKTMFINTPMGGAFYRKVALKLHERIWTLAPAPFTAEEIWTAAFPPRVRAAIRVLDGITDTTLFTVSRAMTVTVGPDSSSAHQCHIKVPMNPPRFWLRSYDWPMPEKDFYDKKFLDEHREWAHYHAGLRRQRDLALHEMERVFNKLQTAEQVVRVWPSLGKALPALPKLNPKVRLPNECYIAGKGGAVADTWRPERFEQTTALICEALMLPPGSVRDDSDPRAVV